MDVDAVVDGWEARALEGDSSTRAFRSCVNGQDDGPFGERKVGCSVITKPCAQTDQEIQKVIGTPPERRQGETHDRVRRPRRSKKRARATVAKRRPTKAKVPCMRGPGPETSAFGVKRCSAHRFIRNEERQAIRRLEEKTRRRRNENVGIALMKLEQTDISCQSASSSTRKI